MRKVHGKMYREDRIGARDKSYWRKATFNNVRSASTCTCSLDVEGMSCADNSFPFSEARKPFPKFCPQCSSSKKKTPFSFFAMFDAITTKAVDLFEIILQDLCEVERYIGEKSKQAQIRNSAHHPTAHPRDCLERRRTTIDFLAQWQEFMRTRIKV